MCYGRRGERALGRQEYAKVMFAEMSPYVCNRYSVMVIPTSRDRVEGRYNVGFTAPAKGGL